VGSVDAMLHDTNGGIRWLTTAGGQVGIEVVCGWLDDDTRARRREDWGKTA
jgi:hypothetical protein